VFCRGLPCVCRGRLLLFPALSGVSQFKIRALCNGAWWQPGLPTELARTGRTCTNKKRITVTLPLRTPAVVRPDSSWFVVVRVQSVPASPSEWLRLRGSRSSPRYARFRMTEVDGVSRHSGAASG
jgi:hypothetical protein